MVSSSKQTFVGPEEVVAEQIAFHKDSPRGVHFRRTCPREKGIVQYTGGLRGARFITRIQVTDKSFGIDTAVEAAKRATNAAHVEIESFIAMFSTLAN
ncbi:6-phosphofructokinase [Salix suchowensis]|nr:6-phosphofructokinase [Salix suchowensis]